MICDTHHPTATSTGEDPVYTCRHCGLRMPWIDRTTEDGVPVAKPWPHQDYLNNSLREASHDEG